MVIQSVYVYFWTYNSTLPLYINKLTFNHILLFLLSILTTFQRKHYAKFSNSMNMVKSKPQTVKLCLTNQRVGILQRPVLLNQPIDHKWTPSFKLALSVYISCLTLHRSLSLWASYQIRKIAGCACAGNAGNVFPRRRFQRKLLVSDPGMHHSTCVTHVLWCMSGSLTCGDGENVPGIPGACAPAILRIW